MYYTVKIYDENGTLIPNIPVPQNPLYLHDIPTLKLLAPRLDPVIWFNCCLSFLLDKTKHGEHFLSSLYPSNQGRPGYEDGEYLLRWGGEGLMESTRASPLYYHIAMSYHPFFVGQSALRELYLAPYILSAERKHAVCNLRMRLCYPKYPSLKSARTSGETFETIQNEPVFHEQEERNAQVIINTLEQLPQYPQFPRLSNIELIPVHRNQIVVVKCLLPRECIPPQFICPMTELVMDEPVFDGLNHDRQTRYDRAALLKQLAQQAEHSVAVISINVDHLQLDAELKQQIELFIQKIKVVDQHYPPKILSLFQVLIMSTSAFCPNFIPTFISKGYTDLARTIYQQYRNELGDPSTSVADFTKVIADSSKQHSESRWSLPRVRFIDIILFTIVGYLVYDRRNEWMSIDSRTALINMLLIATGVMAITLHGTITRYAGRGREGVNSVLFPSRALPQASVATTMSNNGLTR